MVTRWIPAIVALAACDAGARPDLLGLTDQVAVVGQQFTLELEGVDPDGDQLFYRVAADFMLDNATVTKTPTGRGLFRWTPIAADVGMHLFDFTVSDGANESTVTITIDVRATAGGVPVFQQPLSTGRVVNLTTDPCITVDILIEDQDTAQVTIAEEEPRIAGAMFEQLGGTMARWTWCPTPAQVAETDRYTLVLSADDGDHPKTLKHYVIVLSGGGGGMARLVINEVDYDNVGTDSAEYLELFNPSATAASLAGLAVVLVNGATNTPYQTIDLSPIGSLGPGRYLVLAGPNVSVPAPAVKLDPLWTQDQIQNGAPDGVALIDDVSHTVIDALSYEGSLTAVPIAGFATPVSLVEGTALDAMVADSNTIAQSLCRRPNGGDSNNAATDWALCTALTIGAANPP